MAISLSSIFRKNKSVSESNGNEMLVGKQNTNGIDSKKYFESKISKCGCTIVDSGSEYLELALNLRRLFSCRNHKPIRDAINFGEVNESSLAGLISVKEGYIVDFVTHRFGCNVVVFSKDDVKIVERDLRLFDIFSKDKAGLCQYLDVKNNALGLWAFFLLCYFSVYYPEHLEPASEFLLTENDYKTQEEVKNKFSVDLLPHLYYDDSTLYIKCCFYVRDELRSISFTKDYWQVKKLADGNVEVACMNSIKEFSFPTIHFSFNFSRDTEKVNLMLQQDYHDIEVIVDKEIADKMRDLNQLFPSRWERKEAELLSLVCDIL